METAGDKDKHFVTLNIYEIAVQTAKEKRLGIKISFKDKSYIVDAPDRIVTKNWNRLRFAFAVTVEDLTQGHVQVEVVEKGAAMFGKDRVLGEAHVPVNQLLKRHARNDKDSAQVTPETILVFNSKEKDAAKASVDIWCEAYGWQHMLLLLKNPDTRSQALTDMERMTTRPKKKDIRQSLTDAGDTKVAVYMVQAFYEEIMAMLEEVISNPALPWRQQMFTTFEALCAENRTRQKMIEFGILASFRRFLRDQVELKSPGGSSKSSTKKPKSPRVSEQVAQNDNEVKLLVLKCLKNFFSSAGVQRQIIREKMLDVLIKKLSNETPEKILLTTFEVLRYFDRTSMVYLSASSFLHSLTLPKSADAHIEQMLERDILKKLKSVATNESPSVQSEVLEMIKFFGLGYKDVLEEEKIPKYIRKLIHSADTNVKLKALDVFQKFKFPEPDEQNAVQNIGALVSSFDPDGNPLMKIKILDKLQSEVQKDEEAEKIIAEKTDILKLLTRCLVDISTVVRDKASGMISSFKVVTKKQLVDAGILLTWKEMILNKKLQSEYRDKTVQALADYFRDIGPEVEKAGLIPVVADVIGDDSFSMDTRFVAVDVVEKLEDRLFWSAAHDAGVLAKIVTWASTDSWTNRAQQSSLLYRCLMWIIRALNIQLNQQPAEENATSAAAPTRAEILAEYKERFNTLIQKMVHMPNPVSAGPEIRQFLERFLPLFRLYFDQKDFVESAILLCSYVSRVAAYPHWVELGGPTLWTDLLGRWNDIPIVNSILSQITEFLAEAPCAKIEGSSFFKWPWPEELLDRLLVLTVPRPVPSTTKEPKTESEAQEASAQEVSASSSSSSSLTHISPADEAARIARDEYSSDHNRIRRCQMLWQKMFRHDCVRKFLDLGGLAALSSTMTDSSKAHDIRSVSGELLSIMVKDPEVLAIVMQDRALFGCLISYIDLLAWNQIGPFLTIIRQLLNDRQNFKDFCNRNSILRITTQINNSQWDRTALGRSLRAACIDIVAFFVQHGEKLNTLMDNSSAIASLSVYLGMEDETANFDACAMVFWRLTQRSDWTSKSNMWNNYIFYRFDELCRQRAQYNKQFSLGFLLLSRAAAQVIKETGRSTPSNDLNPAIAVLNAYHMYLPATDTAIFCEKRRASRPPPPALPEPDEAKEAEEKSSSSAALISSSSSRKALKKEKGKQKDDEPTSTTMSVDIDIAPASETSAPTASSSSESARSEEQEVLVASLLSAVDTLDLSKYAAPTTSSSSSSAITLDDVKVAIDSVATDNIAPPPVAPARPMLTTRVEPKRKNVPKTTVQFRKGATRRNSSGLMSSSSSSGSGSPVESETGSDTETISLSRSSDVQVYNYGDQSDESASSSTGDEGLLAGGNFGTVGPSDVTHTEFTQVLNPAIAKAPSINSTAEWETFINSPVIMPGDNWAVSRMLPWFPEEIPATITVGEFATQACLAIFDFLSSLDFKTFPAYSMTTFTQALGRITVKTATTLKPAPPVQGRMLALLGACWQAAPAGEKPKLIDFATIFCKNLLQFSDEPSELNAAIRVCSFIPQGSNLLTEFTAKKEFRDTIATAVCAAEVDVEACISLCKMLGSIRAVVSNGVSEDSNRAVKITLKKYGDVGRAVTAAMQLLQLIVASNLESLKKDKELFSLILATTTKGITGVDNELLLNVLRGLASNLGENMSDEDFSSLVLSLWKRIAPGSQSNTMKEASGFLVHLLNVDPDRVVPLLSEFNFWKDMSKLFGGAQHIYLMPIMSMLVSKSSEFTQKLVKESLASCTSAEANLFVRVMCVVAGSLPEGKARSVVATPEVLAKVAEYTAPARQVSIAGALDGMEWAYLVADHFVNNNKEKKWNTDWTVIRDRLQSSLATWSFHQYCFYFKVFNQKIKVVPALDPWEEPRTIVRIGKHTSNMLIDRDLCIFGNNQPSLESALGNTSVNNMGGVVYFQVYTRILPSWCSLQVGWASQSAFDSFNPLCFVGVGQAKKSYSYDALNNRTWKEGAMLPVSAINVGKFFQGHVVSCYLDTNKKTIGIKTSTTELVDLITDVDLSEPLFPCVSIDSDANVFFKFDLTPTWFGGVKYSPIT